MTVNREAMINVLMLLIDNSNTSASACGLRERENNRREAINLLLSQLEISEQEADEMYSKYIEAKETE